MWWQMMLSEKHTEGWTELTMLGFDGLLLHQLVAGTGHNLHPASNKLCCSALPCLELRIAVLTWHTCAGTPCKSWAKPCSH